MYPSFRSENGTDKELRARVKVRLSYSVDDAGRCVCGGRKLRYGEGFNGCFGSEQYDGAVEVCYS